MKEETKNVDITQKSEVTCVEWFHGYGGNALGLKRAIPGLQSVAVCERDAFVVANMVSKMEKGLLDAVPIWTDVTDFPTQPFGRGVLDLFVASYPCQGFSHAGKRLGVDDHRHLWPYCRKFIGAVRPRYVWLENVEGHVSLGLSTVLADLEEDGYTAAWGIFSASEVGAPHQRKRVFILAYDNSRGLERTSAGRGERTGDAVGDNREGSEEDVAHLVSEGPQGHAGDVNREGREPGGEDRSVAEGGLSLCDTTEQGLPDRGGPQVQRPFTEQEPERPNCWPSRPGEQQHGWEPPRVVGVSQNLRVEGREYVDTGSDRQGEGTPQFSGAGSGEAKSGQAQPPLGGNADGPAAGLDFPRCTGLSDTELAEIYSWMVKGTNRTDELRMCGNGVVSQTAEKAFRVLYEELRNK